MKTRFLAVLAIAAAAPVTLALHAFAQDPAAEAMSGAIAEAMNKMMHGMHVAPTGDADKDFVLMMIPHHQGAIDMARIELEYGDDPQIRAVAEAVIAAQEEEIALMKRWLEANP